MIVIKTGLSFYVYLILSLSLYFFSQAQAKTRHKVMGVLDIYGFEIFEVRAIAHGSEMTSHLPSPMSVSVLFALDNEFVWFCDIIHLT